MQKEKLVSYIMKKQQIYEGTEIDLVLDILLQKINNGVFD
ncbi:hypothetical protein SIXOD_v1c14250 [Spiroplasma ixodetis Y32]|nr:hypothetical protein SIXOD_v1c14250 [Spiroplasma ixodetis Y32]